MRTLALALALAAAAGCGPEAGLWVRIEAPLKVPEECDAVELAVLGSEGPAAFERSYDLTAGPAFPLTLSLVAEDDARLGQELRVRARALKAGALSYPWSDASALVHLVQGELAPVVIRLCDCAPAELP